MISGLSIVLVGVLVFLIEKFAKNFGIRFVLVSIVLIVCVIISVNVGMIIGRSLEENSFNRDLMFIFSSLRDYPEAERGKVLDELKQRMSDGGESSKVENLLNYLEWNREEGFEGSVDSE